MTKQKQTRWGIIGPGGIAHNFADGLAECTSGVLTAIASRSAERRTTFGDDYAIAADKRFATYEALVADPENDAVYISTPHPWHAELAIMAMRAGKPVLVEKPGGMNAAEIVALTEVAAQQQVFFMEAFMYRCHPQIARVLEIVAAKEIGTLTHIRTFFGFNAAFNPASRLYDPALGGGGILDVGGYPASLARLIAGAAVGKPFDEPVEIKGLGLMAPTGVDQVAHALLRFEGGFTAEIACAIARPMDNAALITGTHGAIRILDPWVPGRNNGPSDATLEITVNGKMRTEVLRDPRMLFAFEAEVVSRAIAEGLTEAPYPAVSHTDSIGNNRLLDAWRKQVGYRTFADKPATNRVLPGVLQRGLPGMPMARLPGLDRDVSRLILGCDNKAGIADGAIVWDAWIEAGGNAFDTAFVYGAGAHEAALGDWITARGVAKDIVTVVKGAHSPYCLPGAIAPQLDASLARLQLDSAPIYILHRDNPDVPVGEFIDALNRECDAGRIGIFGGSNWSPERLADANSYAEKHGLRPMRILNNNLSLAVMEKPVWGGCLTSNTPSALAALRQCGAAHISWSAQARGYFLPEDLRDRLPPEIGPEQCFGSKENAERRRRAETLAAEQGVTAHNVALAWVLAQVFPSFALIGPRSAGELVSTLPALSVALTDADRDWLNLERDGR